MRMASYFPPLVVAGCSGAGKGTLIAKLMAWDPEAFGFKRFSHYKSTEARRGGRRALPLRRSRYLSGNQPVS